MTARKEKLEKVLDRIYDSRIYKFVDNEEKPKISEYFNLLEWVVVLSFVRYVFEKTLSPSVLIVYHVFLSLLSLYLGQTMGKLAAAFFNPRTSKLVTIIITVIVLSVAVTVLNLYIPSLIELLMAGN